MRLKDATSEDLVDSVLRGLESFKAGKVSAGQYADGLRKIADAFEKLDASKKVKTEDVKEVFAFWVKETGRDPTRTKLTPERDRRIRGRLRDGYSVSDVKAAVANVARSTFHMGENDRGVTYSDITLICRSGSQLEQYRDMGPVAPDAPQQRGQLQLAAEAPARQKVRSGPDW